MKIILREIKNATVFTNMQWGRYEVDIDGALFGRGATQYVGDRRNVR